MAAKEDPVVRVELHCTQFPGRRFCADGEVFEPVSVGVQREEEVIGRVPGDSRNAVLRAEFRIARQKDGSPNFLGPYSKGTPRERFFYLSWGAERKDGSFATFRRAKIPLWKLGWKDVETAIALGQPIRGDVMMTDRKGGPACATLKDELFRWRV